MMMFNKKIFLITLGLILILLGSWFVYSQQKNQFYKKVLADNEALLIIKNGKERWFKGEVVNGMTISDVLLTSSRAGGFDLENDWHCFINGKAIEGNLSQITVNPRDKISCEY